MKDHRPQDEVGIGMVKVLEAALVDRVWRWGSCPDAGKGTDIHRASGFDECSKEEAVAEPCMD